jgi:hypothetical protein
VHDLFIVRFLVWKPANAEHSLNVIMAQLRNLPFGVNITIDLRNITTSSDNISTLLIQNIPPPPTPPLDATIILMYFLYF